MRRSIPPRSVLFVLALSVALGGLPLVAGGGHSSDKATSEPTLQTLMEQMSHTMKRMSATIQADRLTPARQQEIGDSMDRMADMMRDMAGMVGYTNASTDAGSKKGGHMMMGAHGRDMSEKMRSMSDEMAEMHQSMMATTTHTSDAHQH